MANKLKYRQAWGWPQRVEDFIASRARGFTVHLMNGSSKFGDLRIDRYTETTDIKADALCLPLKSEVADTVVCDPPWDMDVRLRIKLMDEIRRILKFGGQLIFNSRWSPKCPGLPIEEIWVPEWQLMTFHDIALIFVSRKIRKGLI
jgi:hypothetical protein